MNIILGENNATFTAVLNGSYAVIVTEGTCSDTSACQLIATIGLEEIESDNMVVISPNPTEKLVWLESLYEPIESIEIITLNGSMVQRITALDTKYQQISLDGEPGVYLLKYKLLNGVQKTIRIVKL